MVYGKFECNKERIDKLKAEIEELEEVQKILIEEMEGILEKSKPEEV